MSDDERVKQRRDDCRCFAGVRLPRAATESSNPVSSDFGSNGRVRRGKVRLAAW